MLNPTPIERMVDAAGRPYFLPGLSMTLEQFRKALADPNPQARAVFLAELLRNARADDVFFLVSPGEILEMWPLVEDCLGDKKDFWRWLLDELEERCLG
ncbi:MAG TPA: hypothetical protein VF173_12750 [Thermoanaerobaculia bacterium]|nr:hypothetical protein [Thermoanaerobaculia bacterium]